jgi:hypothetical protein
VKIQISARATLGANPASSASRHPIRRPFPPAHGVSLSTRHCRSPRQTSGARNFPPADPNTAGGCSHREKFWARVRALVRSSADVLETHRPATGKLLITRDTARHRSPSLLRNASTRCIRRPGCPLAARTHVPTPAVSANQPSLGCSAQAHLGWPRAQPSGPRSHCFEETHQVRGRAAKRTRHRAVTSSPPADGGQRRSGPSSSRPSAKSSQAERRCGSRKLAR